MFSPPTHTDNLDEKLFPRPNNNGPGKPAIAGLPRIRSGAERVSSARRAWQ
ncbi:MAG: hypothetical protein AB1585_04650 [Thermodesulfobacteriota bacterium]